MEMKKARPAEGKNMEDGNGVTSRFTGREEREMSMRTTEGGISQRWEQRVGAWCIQQVSQRVVNEAKC